MIKKQNKFFFLSITAIALMIVYLAVGDKFTTSTYTDLINNKSNFDEIVIKKQASEIKLFKKDGKWFVGKESFPADPEIVKNIEKDLRALKITDQISKGEYASKYDLDSDKVVEIKITFADKNQKMISAGKKSSTNNHIYLKTDGKPEIYLAAGTIDSVISKSADDFRSKEIFRITPDSISSFEIINKGKKFYFTKRTEEKTVKGKIVDGKQSCDDEKIKVDSWMCAGYENIKLDAGKVTELLSDFNPLKAVSFIADEKKPLNPSASIKIKSDGKDFELAIFEKSRDKYFLKSSESAYLFNVEDSIVKKILIENIEELKAPLK